MLHLSLTVLQQPFHPSHAILSKLLREFSVFPPRPEAMWKARVKLHEGLDSILFSQYLFVDQSLVTKRIHPANLEVRWWKTCVGLEVDWIGQYGTLV